MNWKNEKLCLFQIWSPTPRDPRDHFFYVKPICKVFVKFIPTCEVYIQEPLFLIMPIPCRFAMFLSKVPNILKTFFWNDIWRYQLVTFTGATNIRNQPLQIHFAYEQTSFQTEQIRKASFSKSTPIWDYKLSLQNIYEKCCF